MFNNKGNVALIEYFEIMETLTSKKVTAAVSNTYPAKTWLKAAGFTYVESVKMWHHDNFNASEWESKYCNPTWNGRGNAKLCAAVKFETKETIS